MKVMKKSNAQRYLAAILAVCLIFGMSSISVLATEIGDTGESALPFEQGSTDANEAGEVETNPSADFSEPADEDGIGRDADQDAPDSEDISNTGEEAASEMQPVAEQESAIPVKETVMTLAFDEPGALTSDPVVLVIDPAAEYEYGMPPAREEGAVYADLSDALSAALDGDTIRIADDLELDLTSGITVKGITVTADKGVVVTVTGTASIVLIDAVVEGVTIEKHAKSYPAHDIINMRSGATVANCTFTGSYELSANDDEVTRAISVSPGAENILITGNTFKNLRQPAYIDQSTGEVSHNYVDGTKGFVVSSDCQLTFAGNSFGTNAVDIAIINGNGENAPVTANNYLQVGKLSRDNNGAVVENQISKTYAADGGIVMTIGGDISAAESNGQALSNALSALAEDDILKVYPGYYNMPQNDTLVCNNQTGWYFPVTEDGVTIVGVDQNGETITDPSAAKAYIYSTVYTANGSHSTQNLITVFGDDVTLQGLVVMNKVSPNKGIEVIGDGFTVTACRFAPIAENLLPAGGVEDNDGNVIYNHEQYGDYGSGVYFQNSVNSVVEDSIFDRSGITFDSTDNASIAVTGNTFRGMKKIGATEYATIGYTSWSDPKVWDLSNSQITISKNAFYETGLIKFDNVEDGTVDASKNYWGSPSPDFESIIVGDTVSYEPYFKSESMRDPQDLNTYRPAKSSSGASSADTSPSVSINDRTMGTVSVGSDNRTITITPAAGCQVKEVVINGSSVGAVTRYVLSKADSSNTVVVIFEKNGTDENYGSVDGESIPFSDVSNISWYYSAVRYAYMNGLFSGISDTDFGPDEPMTRAMLVTVLQRMEGSPQAEDVTFTDVKAGAWYSEAVAWAAQENIVQGTGGNRFSPDALITREQLAVILFNYANYSGWETSARADLSSFNDSASVSSWAQDSLQWAVAAGIVSGKGNETLDPAGSATRAEVASILMRLADLAENTAGSVDSSNSEESGKTM